jgi:exodeoxyribonuclease V beta subunit
MLGVSEFNVIESPLSGTNLIEASAGTGKTYAISIIFLRLIVENNFRIEDILVVTFTIPATMELRLRIRDRLRDAVSVIEDQPIKDKTITLLMKKYKGDNIVKQRILTSLKSFDQSSVYTIHSFCQQMLVDNAFESGSLFSSEIVNDNAFIERGVTDLCRVTLYNTSPALVSYFMENCSVNELIELYKKRPLSPDLRIEPEDSDADIESLEGCRTLIEKLYAELSDVWSSESDRVRDIFCNSKVLKGNIYKEESMDALIEEMNDYIAGETPFAFFDRFYNYTSEKIKDSLKKGCEYPESAVFEICRKIYTANEEYNNAGALMLISIKKRLFDVIDDLVLSSKSQNSRRSFDDLIKDAQRGLNGKSGKLLEEKVRARYKAALIDEFQDTDNLQFDIFSRLFNNEKTILFLIGDPKQAIYRFRGADIFSYMKASQLMKNRYTLAQNWRSRPELIGAVNAVFERCKDPFIFDKIQFYPVRPGEENQGDQLMKRGVPIPPFDIWLSPDGAESAGDMLIEKLSSEISLLINRGDESLYTLGGRPVVPGDIAVLVRTRKQGAAVRDAFAAYSIPSVSRGMDNVFKSDEAGDLYFIVSAIADPANYNLVKAASSTIAMGGSADLLYGYHRNSPEGKDGLDAVTSRFYNYRESWISGGFLNMITGFLEKESVASRLFALSGGERMVTNINHIAEILHDAEHKNDFTPREMVTWFGNTLSDPPDDDEYSMRLERDDDAVNIVTMHACKGLEFPVVYCPFLAHSNDGKGEYVIYHDPDDHDRPVLYLDKNVPDEVKAIKASEDLAENIRLLYVALTRAKSACRVMFAPNKIFGKSAAFHIFVKSAGSDVPGYSREILDASLRDLHGSSGGRISFSDGTVSKGIAYIAGEHSAEEIAVRKFTGEVKSCWKTHSYSAIARSFESHVDADGKDFKWEFNARKGRGEGIFGFASGTRAGLCIHEIFEKTDFTTKDRISVTDICSGLLEKYRFDISSKDHLADMFFNVVNSVLDDRTGLKLSDIDDNSRLTELEFSFPVDIFNSYKFRDIFKGGDLYCSKIYNRLSGDHSEPGGMMKGFIDLIFEHDGKYYIADWKSNHLGNSFNDYTTERLTDEMEKHNYFLQYYIYSAALIRYLKHRLGDNYSYDKHFGGIYYFFVRGMNPEIENSPGIFFDRPDIFVLEKLDKYFAGVK